jgi:uncharacterized membrane protein YphA (DoxX/SURF4 family)
MDMSFSQFSGTAIVPTLSRLVLALAFITIGFDKLTTDAAFSAAEAQRLKAVGVDIDTTRASADPVIFPALYPQEEGAAKPPEQEMAAPPKSEQTAPPGEAPAPEEGKTKSGEDNVIRLPQGQYSARTLHIVTLYCEDAGFGKYSPYLAWLSALTEFGGGILILVGFLGRIWGLGLAINMGMAIYLTAWGPYFDKGPFIVAQGADGFALFNQTFTQLGLGVLALGILLTGPGPLSLDRLVFGKRGGGRSSREIGGGPSVGSMPAAGPARGVVPERKPQPQPQPRPEEPSKPAGGRPL